MSQTTYLVFVQTAPGLEPLLFLELAELGLSGKPRDGGVELRANRDDLFRICLGSRLAEGVRVRLKSFVARDFDALERGLRKLPFRAYLPKNSSAEVRVTSHRSRLWHSGAIEERLGTILLEQCEVVGGRREDGATAVYVRITGDAVQVSIDAGGRRLHRRGYRTKVEKASVRETLASALVLATLDEVRNVAAAAGVMGASSEVPEAIWDPFCGAGTVGTEALLWARGILPGSFRSFGFETWPTHDAEAFDAVRKKLAKRCRKRAPAPDMRAYLSDVSAKAIASSESNAEAADVADGCTLIEGDIEDVAGEIPKRAWVLTNPPYGKRLAEGGAMKKLEKVLAKRKDLRPVGMIIGGPSRKLLPASYRVAARTKSGGASVSLRVRTEK